MHAPISLHRNPYSLACLALLFSVAVEPNLALGQVRTKKPDRGVYQPPRLPQSKKTTGPADSEFSQWMRSRDGRPASQTAAGRVKKSTATVELAAPTPIQVSPKRVRPIQVRPKRKLVEVELTNALGEPDSPAVSDPRRVDDRFRRADGGRGTALPRGELTPVRHQNVILVSPAQDHPSDHSEKGTGAAQAVYDPPPTAGPPPSATLLSPGHTNARHRVIDRDSQVWEDAVVEPAYGGFLHDSTCDGCPDCLSPSCDSIGCDSIGSCDSPWFRRWSNSSLRFTPDRWFGSAEVMLMFRKGNRFPPLITTGPGNDPDTAGELGQPGTQILVGGDTVLKDMTAGGRFTLGTWIDGSQYRSLVLRGWIAGEETFGFGVNSSQTAVIARPFLNVSDNQAAAQDALLVAFPNRASGSINVNASSEVYGADVQVRQFLYGKYGGSVDFLYGYQYMRLREDLSINSTSISLDDDFAPLGSVISVADGFDTENEFHGGQVGLSSRYREGCWSFNGLLKAGFGSLTRRAKLNGSTTTSLDGATAVDPNGLLVRSTNAGTINNRTFGWVPELDLSLGWQYFPRFDVTVGYHLIAMTDALQVSQVIDSELAVNLSDPPTGQQRPGVSTRYSTYYLQGIHLGLQYVY